MDSPKKEPKKAGRAKRKPPASRKPPAKNKAAQAALENATSAVTATPPSVIQPKTEAVPEVDAVPEVGPSLDVPLAAFDERARGADGRPLAFRVVPWAMLAVMVIFVMSALRGVMTAPVSQPAAKTAHATPTVSALYRKYRSKAKFRVKVTTPRLNLRAQPAVYSPLLLRIPKGTVLLVMKKKGDWYRIVAPAGNRGWVNANPAYSKRVKK